jgi:ATP-binding protein involved in chromosome partitioning
MNQSDTAQIRMSDEQRQRIGRVILVLSGKGGVGKSTIAVNCAVALAQSGLSVGLLDIDVHGPSIPTMLGLETVGVNVADNCFIPVNAYGMQVMSVGFLLPDNDDAVIWRGPMKTSVIRQLVTETEWDKLDVMIVDLPPGTGDEPLSICQVLGSVDGALVVTTPQKVAAVDVRKSVTFCRKLDVPVLGIVENMSGFACPQCGTVTSILSKGAGRSISEDMDIPFLGTIPIDPAVADAGDVGYAIIQDDTAPATTSMREVVEAIKVLLDSHQVDDGQIIQQLEKD